MGCVSVRSNSARFDPAPYSGMQELEMIQRCGAPDYAGFVEDEKVYVYKVRQSNFFLFFGQFSGYDLVVTAKGGVVKSTLRIPRSSTTAFFFTAPWVGMD
jgi:hypothetical protein